MLQVRIICKGKVQGVGFRYATKEKAITLGLSGNVTNLNDESVVINAIGLKMNLIELIDWCHVGPSPSKIQELLIRYKNIKDQELSGFVILR